MLSLKPYYIDIHTHILPGLDDGSQDEETTLQMAEIAAGNGTKCLVCTKHTDMTEPVSREDGRLIPASEDLITDIDQQARTITMRLPDGLLNL